MRSKILLTDDFDVNRKKNLFRQYLIDPNGQNWDRVKSVVTAASRPILDSMGLLMHTTDAILPNISR